MSKIENLVAIVVAVVPVALVVPTLFVFIPPVMVSAPALLSRLVQFAPFVISFTAMPAVSLNRFVQLVLGMLNVPLASLLHLRL